MSYLLTFAAGVTVGALSGASLLALFLGVFGPQLDKIEARASSRWHATHPVGGTADVHWSHQPPT